MSDDDCLLMRIPTKSATDCKQAASVLRARHNISRRVIMQPNIDVHRSIDASSLKCVQCVKYARERHRLRPLLYIAAIKSQRRLIHVMVALIATRQCLIALSVLRQCACVRFRNLTVSSKLSLTIKIWLRSDYENTVRWTDVLCTWETSQNEQLLCGELQACERHIWDHYKTLKDCLTILKTLYWHWQGEHTAKWANVKKIAKIHVPITNDILHACTVHY